MVGVPASKPKLRDKSRAKSINIFPQPPKKLLNRESEGGRSSLTAQGSVNNYLPFVLFWVEEAGEARLIMWY